MEMKINVVEAASELAYQYLRDMIYDFIPEEKRRENWEDSLYKDPESETLEYTEEWQDIFNKCYDYYFEIITGCSVK